MPLSSAPGALSGLHQRLSWILSCPVARRCVAAQAASPRNPHRNTHAQGPSPPRKAKLPPRSVRKQGAGGTPAWKPDRANSSHGISRVASSSIRSATLGHPHAQGLQDAQRPPDTVQPVIQQPEPLQPQQQPQQDVKQRPKQAQQQPPQAQPQSAQRGHFPTRGRPLHHHLRGIPRQRLQQQVVPPQAQQTQQQQQAPTGTTYAPSQQPVQAGRSKQHEALSVNMTGVVNRITAFADSDFKVLRFASKQVKSCSNGVSISSGWQPKDLQQATAALAARGGYNNPSSSTSRRSTSSSNPHAARAASNYLYVTGQFGAVREGVAYSVSGEWKKHHKYGWQIECVHYTQCLELADAKTYLLNLPGIGSSRAESIIKAEGDDMEDIIKMLSQPEQAVIARLKQIGIPVTVARDVKATFDRERDAGSQLIQLQQQFNLDAKLARKVIRHFANDADAAILRMSDDPYHLYRTLPGYSLHQAEATAAALRFDAGAPERGAAYLQEALLKALFNSSTGLTWEAAQKHALDALQAAAADPYSSVPPWPQGLGLRAAAELLIRDGKLVVEQQQLLTPQQQQTQGQVRERHRMRHHDHHHHSHQQQQQQQQQQELYEFKVVSSGWSDDAFVYLKEIHQAEQDVLDFLLAASAACCEALKDLTPSSQQPAGAAATAAAAPGKSAEQRHPAVVPSSSSLLLPVTLSESDLEVIEDLEASLSCKLDKPVAFNEGQRVALMLAEQLPVLMVTGGPGCGKTLVSQAVAQRCTEDLFMAAPTGRAAQRLQEVFSDQNDTGMSSSTIHRLLGYRNNAVLKRTAAAAAADAASGSSQASVADLTLDDDVGQDLDLGSSCEFNRNNPLPGGNYLVDEVSMMDTPLTAALFSALRPEMECGRQQLMLVGDPDQLPPVGAGQPLADALAEGILPNLDLRQIYRTHQDSTIVASAHAINRGELPAFTAEWDIQRGATVEEQIKHHITAAAAAGQPGCLLPDGAVLWVRLHDDCHEQDVAAALAEVTKQLLPQIECDKTLDVQVLSPIKKGAMGTEELNSVLQDIFNPNDAKGPKALPKAELQLRHKRGLLRVGDRVTHLKNDTQLDVYNGDQGYVERINTHSRTVTVRYPPRVRRGLGSSGTTSGSDSDADSRVDDSGGFHRVTYGDADILDMLQLSWATTVHKAQGGEFPVVLMPLHRRAGKNLRRQLLYTAASRAQKLLVIVGTHAAIMDCLVNSGPVTAETYRFRQKLRAARVRAGLPTIEKAVFGPQGWP